MRKDSKQQIKNIFKDFNVRVLNVQKHLLDIKKNIEKREYKEKLKKIKSQ
ncbi:MAG: hypothetical protein PHZ07_01765 [Patescibacteria group bacterium]|nr:hypothetical protein [Patescibacteria group bacterium]MDD4304087.1 hypothetical protein [Patescibacteria group bacterium]MDD4694964.1 hypothetical protein [Patescibacteria group bacterium]